MHIEDRGYQFADGVYEVWEVRGGRLIDEGAIWRGWSAPLRELAHRHADDARRRSASCCARCAPQPRRATAWSICRSRRGVAPRDHAFPAAGPAPAVVVTAQALDRAGRSTRGRAGSR